MRNLYYFPEFLALLHFSKWVCSQSISFQMISGGSGNTAAITSVWLVGYNPVYQVFLQKQSQIDKLDFIKITKLLCFK